MKSYWNHTGKYPVADKALHALIPHSGECPDAKGANRALDRYRRAGNCYYDLFNNGLCNRGAEFRALFKVGALPRKPYSTRLDFAAIEEQGKVEARMNQLIEQAAEEQGIPLDQPAS